MKNIFENLKHDLPASIVVFFVAVPLCLGIALASGAPLFAGIIAGIVGGIVVGGASGSALGVSGPAAGLAVIVFSAIATLGSWEAFLMAVVIAGIIQIILGFLKLGTIAYYFPNSVIKGMLSGIGLLIILKQIPHAFGYDKDYEGDMGFNQPDGENTFSEILKMTDFINPGAIIIAATALFILILWDQVLMKKHKIFSMINGPLVAVSSGIILNILFQNNILPFSLTEKQIVQVPVSTSFSSFIGQFTMPDFSHFTNINVYTIAIVLAIVASLETLLSVEATDKLDPFKRVTPTNRELKAQGIGNIISGLIGGLPLTQVIVRSSANISFGGRTKMSAIIHGVLILISAIFIPRILNLIPLASLASVLFVVGYKLAKPSLFKQAYKLGWEQFIPFIATIVGILLTDLLKGIAIGMGFAIFYLLRNNFRNPFYVWKNGDKQTPKRIVTLSEEVSFLNKGSILQMLNHVPEGCHVIIDGTKSKFIHYDVMEIIKNFMTSAKTKNITVELQGLEIDK
ncbi:MAG: SulP family inorganic anion transporter [Candidatus Competibacteraceae bacterium]|nr:SulP family inorganic anion transporter [Candidatus Competibacteraceae bacterium]